MSKDTFTKQKDLIKQFLEVYDTSPLGLRIGLLNYDKRKVLSQFDNFDDNDLAALVDQAGYAFGGRISNAFQDVHSSFFGDPRVYRSYATKALVLLSGNRFDERRDDLVKASQPLLTQDVKILSVSVGNNPNNTMPKAFVSDVEYIFEFEKVRELPSLVPKVHEAILKGRKSRKLKVSTDGSCVSL